MRQIRFLLPLLLLLAAKNINAAETEPNNTSATANTLALNGSNTGAINVAGDEDWFKVITNADGKLDVTITVSNGLTLRCYIYDNNGTTLLSSGYSSSTATVSYDGAAAGTYYIKPIAFYSAQLPAYTVSNTLTVPAQANDVEPNNTKAQATVLPLNASKTGHVGYYYNLKRDTADWYKITTNAEGLLRVTATPANGETIRIYLYDNDGTTLLNSAYSSTKATLDEDGLANGTYYVRVFSFYDSRFEPYTIADSLFKPVQANDAEPNDSKAQATVLLQDAGKTSLTPATMYYWHVAAADSANGVTGIGAYTDSISFTTAASFSLEQSADDAVATTTLTGNAGLSVYPNPAQTFFTIKLDAFKINVNIAATLKDMNGNIVWSRNTSASALNNNRVDVTNLSSGMYILQLTDEMHTSIITKKVIVSR